MPKKKSQKQQPLDNSSIDQLEMAGADSGFALFCEDKKLTEPTYIHICLLKKFFEIFKASRGYQCTDQIDIEAFGDKLSTEYLKKIFNFSCQSDSKSQDVIKVDQQDLIPVVLLSKLQTLISNLESKKNYDITCKKIFFLMDRMLPYYLINIRDVFNLHSLFASIEKNRVIFFKNLNNILSSVPRSILFEQIQISCLCSMLFWVSHPKTNNFYLIIDALLILSKYNLESFMFKAYTLTDNEVISILPAPLRIIDILTKNYDVGTTDIKEIKKFQVLNNVKNNFLDLQKQNSLQMSLRREFIFFVDYILDFALTTNTKNRTFILKYYDNFRPLIKKIFLSYNSSSMSFQALIISNTILEMMDKWQNCIKTNLHAFEKSEQTGLELSAQEDLEINAHNNAVLAQALQTQPSKKTIQAAQQFAEKKLKNAEEEKCLKAKERTVSILTQPSHIDQYQNYLTNKLPVNKNIKNSEKENIYNTKDTIFLQEIIKYINLVDIKAVNIDSLEKLIASFLLIKKQFSENDLHVILLLYIYLLDNFLDRISCKMIFYKENYSPLIGKMFARHGQADFGRRDHVDNKIMKKNTPLILDNLISINGYCDCILKIFDIIQFLKIEITDNEFYKIWNLPINFRKAQYEDIYKDILANITQFEAYRNTKREACKTRAVQTSSRKRSSYKINEGKITRELENLKVSFEQIAKILNANVFENIPVSQYLAKVSISKQIQARNQQLQNTIINSTPRIPIPYKPYQTFRSSQSCANLYLYSSVYEKNMALTKKLVFKDNSSSFFKSESESQATIDEAIHLVTNKTSRRMSI